MYDKSLMPTDVSIITTYRCQMRCKMCNIWENPTDRKKEITPEELENLPNFKFVNNALCQNAAFFRQKFFNLSFFYAKIDSKKKITNGRFDKKNNNRNRT